MGNTKEPVVFTLPDGTEVSNDPRKAEDDLRKQMLANLTQSQEFVAKQRAQTDQAKKEPAVDEDDLIGDDDERSGDPEDPDGGSSGDGSVQTQEDDQREAENLGDATTVSEPEGLEDMKTEELKQAVSDLRGQGVEVETKGVKNKSDLVKNIRAAIAQHNSNNS